MLSRGVGLTSLQRVNLYPTVTPDPDPVTKVWRRNNTQVFGGTTSDRHMNVDMRNDKNCNLCNKRNYLFGICIASTN